MSISVKISQLNEGGAVQSTDQVPVSRNGLDTFRIPANQFVVNGSNIGVGSGQLYFDRSTGPGTTLQFRSLSGVDGLAVVNQGNTLVISASGQNPVKTSITGNGVTTTYAINGANSVNPNNYRVDIDGVLQEPINDYNIVGSNIVFNPAPPNGGKVTVVSNNLVRAFDIIPSDGSVTPNKLSIGGPNWDTAGNITVTGNLGALVIGTGGPLGAFVINDRTGSGTQGAFYRNANINRLWDQTAGDVISYNSSGNVGIGTSAPNQTLTVNGSISATGQVFGKFPNYASPVGVAFNSVQQAATDLFLTVTGYNSFMGGVGVYVGTTSSPTTLIWQYGDDINTNTKWFSSGVLPIPKDFYYLVAPFSVSGLSNGIESITINRFPVI